MRLLLLCLLATTVFAQNPAAEMEKSIAQQRAATEKQKSSIDQQLQSVEKQRTSVRRQVAAAVKVAVPAEAQPAPTPSSAPAAEAPHSFFTVDWTTPLISRNADCDPVPPAQIGAIVSDVSQREGLAPDLLHAVIQKESAYRPCALSSHGAQGLMQLMPSTAAELGVLDVFNPRENVQGGARYLKQMLERYSGSLPLALAAYNAGPGKVDQAGGIPRIPETIDYVNTILGRLPVQ